MARQMPLRSLAWLAAAIAALLTLAACEGKGTAAKAENPPSAAAAPAADADLGQALFAANCARCHGQGGLGSNQGPPLIHRIYEPGHHGDFSFYQAVGNGVRAHHWSFGDMPPIPGVSAEDTAHIIAYVRREQRRAGIR